MPSVQGQVPLETTNIQVAFCSNILVPHVPVRKTASATIEVSHRRDLRVTVVEERAVNGERPAYKFAVWIKASWKRLREPVQGHRVEDFLKRWCCVSPLDELLADPPSHISIEQDRAF